MIDSERMPGDWNSHAKIMHYFGFQNKKRPCSPFPRTMEHPTGGPQEKETDRLLEDSCNQSDMRIDMLCTRSGNRTRTTIAGHRILSPACLPIPPSEPHTPFLRKATAKIRNILRFYKPLRLLPPQKKRGRRPQRPCVRRSSVSRWRPGWLRRHRARTTGFRGRVGTT